MSNSPQVIDRDNESFRSYAWQVNEALHDWTAKVDTKASVILSLETAVLGIVLLFAGPGKPLGHLMGPAVWVFRGGILFMVAAVAAAGAAIFPQLNRRDARKRWRENYVYFGHLRHWDPADLIATLESHGPRQTNHVLSVQMIALSKIIWRKHTLLQWSMCLVVLGNLGIWAAVLLK
jgi:hypothetical protein